MQTDMKKQLQRYYFTQLAGVNPNSEYSPSFKLTGGSEGKDTKWMQLNFESAAILIKWLQDNYTDNPTTNL